MSNGSASSVTVASPRDRRARIARRVGSARAENVALSGSFVIVCLTIRLINLMVKVQTRSWSVKGVV